VVVLDIDDLSAWAERGLALRRAEVEHVASIVGDEVDRFAVASTALQAAPLVGALRERAEEVRLDELRRYARQLARLEDDQRELVDMITRGLIAKLLHEPSVRLREQAGSPRGERNAAAVADLFDLG
jgi:glutamyl-tRNA reductase